ncbi:MAG TPA: hypothetical protein PLB01_04965 [Thermoanaerobaculia bacterium]|nr:hypothetical protein [Thermoanaerobaculia bacterium]
MPEPSPGGGVRFVIWPLGAVVNVDVCPEEFVFVVVVGPTYV